MLRISINLFKFVYSNPKSLEGVKRQSCKKMIAEMSYSYAFLTPPRSISSRWGGKILLGRAIQKLNVSQFGEPLINTPGT